MQDNKLDAYRNLLERLRYEGGFLIWVKAYKHALNGTPAGRENSEGYRRIHIPSMGMVGVHRLIFLLHHDYLPEFVDHIDGDPRNNKIENLRAATRHENARNVKTPVTNTSGKKGVYFVKSSGKWQVSIRVNDRLKYIGIYSTFDEAAKARDEAEAEFHGAYRRPTVRGEANVQQR